MRASFLYLSNIAFRLIPETRAFGFKARLLKMAGARLAKNVRLCSSAMFLGPGSLEVGEDSWIGHQTLICAGSRISIGKCVDIGPRVYVGTGTHEIDLFAARAAGAGLNKDVVVGDGVWLGAGAIVLPGVTIGDNAVVAAGAVVNSDVPPRVLVGGVPARVIKNL